MKEQDINSTENAFAHNTGIKSRQCDPSKISFFDLDKNYRPREYDKVNKVLPPSQTGNISVGIMRSGINYVQGKRLDPKQLYTLWRKFSKRNQQRQFYLLMKRMPST